MGDRHCAIQCRVCETAFEDDGLLLDCPRSHEPGLLSALYRTKTFEPDTPPTASIAIITGCRSCGSFTAPGAPSPTEASG
jgi:hypothetical protein